VCSIFIASRMATGWPCATLSPTPYQDLNDPARHRRRDAIRDRAGRFRRQQAGRAHCQRPCSPRVASPRCRPMTASGQPACAGCATTAPPMTWSVTAPPAVVHESPRLRMCFAFDDKFDQFARLAGEPESVRRVPRDPVPASFARRSSIRNSAARGQGSPAAARCRPAAASSRCRSMNAGVDFAGNEVGMPQRAHEEPRVRLDAGDLDFRERIGQPRGRAGARLVPGDDFRDHRVVEDGDIRRPRGPPCRRGRRHAARAAATAPACRPTAENPCAGPPHRAAPRWRGRAAQACISAAAAPRPPPRAAATRRGRAR
jgi:hypothetical protein